MEKVILIILQVLSEIKRFLNLDSSPGSVFLKTLFEVENLKKEVVILVSNSGGIKYNSIKSKRFLSP